jgi:hypothetical protein
MLRKICRQLIELFYEDGVSACGNATANSAAKIG